MRKSLQNRQYFFAAIILVALAFSICAYSYIKSELELRQSQNDYLTTRVAKHFRQSLMDRVFMMEMISNNLSRTSKIEDENFREIVRTMPVRKRGFLALNWVDGDGNIAIVEPEAENKAALGRNLLQKPVVAHLLLASRADGKPRISTLVKLYQGMDGLAVYIPLYKNGVHRGWLNGVFPIAEYMNRFLTQNNMEAFLLRITSSNGVDTYYQNKESDFQIDTSYAEQLEIFNQEFEVILQEESSVTLGWNEAALLAIVLLAGFSFFFLAWVGNQWLNAVALAEDKHRRAEWLQMALRAMLHDLANPLAVLKYISERLVAGRPVEGNQIVLQLNRVLDLHKTISSINPDLLSFEHIHLSGIVKDVLDGIDETAKGKDMHFNVRVNSDLQVRGVPTILREGILTNVFVNAVKFSPRGSEISVSAAVINDRVSLTIKNPTEKKENSIADLGNADLNKDRPSKPGTEGEMGSGYGLRQVSFFCDAMGGGFSIERTGMDEVMATITLISDAMQPI